MFTCLDETSDLDRDQSYNTNAVLGVITPPHCPSRNGLFSCVYTLSNGNCMFVGRVEESWVSRCIFQCACLGMFQCSCRYTWSVKLYWISMIVSLYVWSMYNALTSSFFSGGIALYKSYHCYNICTGSRLITSTWAVTIDKNKMYVRRTFHITNIPNWARTWRFIYKIERGTLITSNAIDRVTSDIKNR